MANSTDSSNGSNNLQKSIEQYEEHGGGKTNVAFMKALSHAIDNLPPPPTGGYQKLWKKKWRKRFGPKTNWSMIGAIATIATLVAMLLMR